jgi:Arc/MetJ-type ribon-helix-helix transcriptional regulator
MEENDVEEVEVEVVQEQPRKQGASGSAGSGSVGKAINSFMESLEAALSGRGNSVMVRVNDEALDKLDMLVAAGICKSRSESVAFLLQRGIESSAQLFDRIASVTAQINKLREELLESVQEMDIE